MIRLRTALNVEDVRKVAKRRLPKAIFEVIDGGAGDEMTLIRNRADIQAVELHPKSLVDVSSVDPTTELFGERLAMPAMLAPCSFGRMCHPEGEVAVARAASAAGVGYIMPGAASSSVESVAHASNGGPLWYQIYMKADQSDNARLIDRVKESGFSTLTVSVDTPMKPFRERDLRNGIDLPIRMTPRLLMAGASRPRWAKDFVLGNFESGVNLHAVRSAYTHFDRAMASLRPVTMRDIDWLRSVWDGPLVVKGLLSDDKIRDLASAGVNGVVVSNHGARNLDGVSSTIRALPRVVDAAAGEMKVLIDSGFRRGVDVLRAVAMGADAVLVGRPYMYGLAAGGERGVAHVISILRNEILVAMTFLGCRTLSEVDSSLLRSPRELTRAVHQLATRTRYMEQGAEKAR